MDEQKRVPNLPARNAFSFSVVSKGHSTKGRSTQEVESAIEEEEDDAKLPGFLGEDGTAKRRRGSHKAGQRERATGVAVES